MKFVLKPSLEHMALVKIVISFWNQNDVRALISKLDPGGLYINQWKTIEERVKEKVTQLSLPELLKAKVFGVIEPIGLEILEWMKYYDRYNAWTDIHYLALDLPTHLPAEFCWTPQGTVDSRRTAEVLVRDENLDIFTRYKLACAYCLEDDIVRFWNMLTQDLKDYDWHYFPVISFWSDNMKRGGAGHISYKDAFYTSVRDGNKVAAKYFLQKLIPQEREECLEELSEYIDDADVLCFLLPEMKEDEQKKVLKNKPVDVLQCFLRWPWQSFFIGVANCMWDFLSKKNYEEILGDIIGKVRGGYKDYNYQKLFSEFRQKSPSALKDSFIDESELLPSLIRIKDKENIRIILKDATPALKAKLIYSEEIDYYLTRFIRKDEWDFLVFFIQECLPSKTEILKFKDEFEKRMYFKECSATKKQKWNQLFVFVDNSICQYCKRCVKAGESSSSKRFQNLE